MTVSIKRNSDAGEAAGFADKDAYEILGFTGGSVVVLDDDGVLRDLSRADVDAHWTTVGEKAENARKKTKGKPEPKSKSKD